MKVNEAIKILRENFYAITYRGPDKYHVRDRMWGSRKGLAKFWPEGGRNIKPELMIKLVERLNK